MAYLFPEAIKLSSSLSSVTSESQDDTLSESSSTCCSDSAVPNTFEGPEKNLEIDFMPGVGHPNGLRELSRDELDEMLDACKCQILSKTSNESIDSYVLSESSLFIYSHKMVIKTCGTTTLLRCLPFVQTHAKRLGLEVEWVSYSRKNYSFPEDQLFPHDSYQNEVAYLNSFFPNGSAHVLGPLNDDHWYIYAWDAESHGVEFPADVVRQGDDSESNNNQVEDEEPAANESTLHILMQDMDPMVAKQFFKEDDPLMTSRRMTQESGIADLLPGAVIDDFAFDPCGYSMNGILGDAYYTIHITPESHCSYVSFETNLRMKNYASLLEKVIRCFRPAKFTVTVHTEQKQDLQAGCQEVFAKQIHLPKDGVVYKRKSGRTQAFLEEKYMCVMANWSLQRTCSSA